MGEGESEEKGYCAWCKYVDYDTITTDSGKKVFIFFCTHDNDGEGDGTVIDPDKKGNCDYWEID